MDHDMPAERGSNPRTPPNQSPSGWRISQYQPKGTDHMPTRPTFAGLREAYDYNMKYADEQMEFVARRGDADHMRQYNAIRAMAEYNAAAAIADAVLHMLRDE